MCFWAIKPAQCNYCAQESWSPCSAKKEATAMRSPHYTQLEKVQAQQQRPSAAKNKFINLKT